MGVDVNPGVNYAGVYIDAPNTGAAMFPNADIHPHHEWTSSSHQQGNYKTTRKVLLVVLVVYFVLAIVY